MSTTQWLRAFSLQVQVDKSGSALDLSDFRVKFAVKQAFTRVPNHAEIRIYNLDKKTEDLLINLKRAADPSQAYDPNAMATQLSAGYQGNLAQIFSGQLFNVRKGRESATDTYVEMIAQCGDLAHNNAVVNASLAAGSAPTDHFAVINQAYGPFGVTVGTAPAMSTQRLPRGKVMYGMVRDYLDTLADTQQFTYGYRNGQLITMPLYGNAPIGPLDQAVVLTVATGLIGMPELTSIGVQARALLNPLIQFGGQVKLDNASIQKQAPSVAYGSAAQNEVISDRAISTDGYYKVVAVDHMGDTRGQLWYSDFLAVGVNASQQPLTGPAYASVGPS